MGKTIITGASPQLIALINVAHLPTELVERHQREVLDLPQTGLSAAEKWQQVQDNNALNDAAAYALWRVADYPAATAADLHAKLSFMNEYDMGDGRNWLPELLADAERITGAQVQS